MIYEFTNGTQRQQDLWREAVTHFLHLPADQIALSNAVTFVDPSEVGAGHTDLASTTFTYGSADSTTVVRNDAPGFGPEQQVMEALAASLGLPFSVEKFYMESAAHELGHALYAALPEEQRVAIAQMFGAEGDTLAEIDPPAASWQDRVIEGIAETFKDAFLPRRYRVFSNRTNRKIAYHEYPTFRALWRAGTPSAGATGNPINVELEELPSPDNFERVENPLSDKGRWEKWAPADNAGRISGGVYEPINLLVSSAVRLERLSGEGFAVCVHPQTLLTGAVKNPGSIIALLCADNESGGNAYLLRMKLATPATSNSIWNITVEFWQNGKLKETLIELKEQFLEFAPALEVALVKAEGQLSIWFTEGGGTFGELTSVPHGALSAGYAGVGIEAGGEVLAAHSPRLSRFRAGEFTPSEPGPPIEIPSSSITPEGFLRGSRAKGRPVMGSVR